MMKRREFVRTTSLAAASLAVRGRPVATPHRMHAEALRQTFDDGWRFLRADAQGAHDRTFDDSAWSPASLPHTARIESVVTGEPGSETYQWQGTCWYRKRFDMTADAAGRAVFLKFDGAMNVADVWLNGEHLGRHLGGWLPFGFDVSDRVITGGENVVAVRLDNTDNAITGPKPLAQLDFNPYHGVYRSVHLIIKDSLHITDAILADRPASGGVFVTFPAVSADEAMVRVQVHVCNASSAVRTFHVRHALSDGSGEVVVDSMSEPVELASDADRDIVSDLRVMSPALWSPRQPNLYELRTEVIENGAVVDEEATRIGIRRISITADGFRINGEPMFLRGTNRHQEYPYIGYALSDAAQYRDAQKIKEAGFDYIRLSHYAHAPAFMDACDELGLVVMDCIPGWQYFNNDDPAFTALQYENCRRLIRRSRNHACVILWEVSLNETAMPEEFIRTTHAIAHEEYPGDQCYTCGWTEGYDVFIQARQHGGCRDARNRACLVSEYGDWEYYAQNAGLEQEAWADLAPDEANSRQLRWHGERALLQQATNFQEAHNDNRKTIACADGLWVMFDYNRGYAPDVESSGCMDLFRIAKFSQAFFRSQRAAEERLRNADSGPMAFIASWWTAESSPDVRVFSNCEEVSLHLNGELVERRRPDADRLSTHLAHPPFTFRTGTFRPGTLEAIGHIGGRAVTRHVVRTPGSVARLDLSLDEGGRPFAGAGRDVAFVRASLRDARGTLVPGAWENVFFGATGAIELVGANPFSSEAGIASILVQTDTREPQGTIYALAATREGDAIRVLSSALFVGRSAEPYVVRIATDGSEAGPRSPRYEEPVLASGRVQAALCIADRRIVLADTDVPRFRIPGSVAPREPG